MRRITIIEFSDGNLTGFVWSWEFFLTKRSDGTFSLSAKQTPNDPPAMKIPHENPLRNGKEIFDALETMVTDAGYAISRDHLLEIGRRIGQLSKPIAHQFIESQDLISD